MNLTHRETEALDVLCDTFVPSLAFTKDEDPVLSGAYVADASLFPSASGVNPMVTIMALARHIGRGLVR